MKYVVTGGTGFIGRELLARLLARRGATVFALVRPGSVAKLDALRQRLGVKPARLVPLPGDVGAPKLGLSKKQLAELKQQGIDGFFHLAALYDMAASAEANEAINVDGTRHAIAAAKAMGAGCFHQVSSIAAAGLYVGEFREDMFAEAGPLDHPYLRSKHESERIVRDECQVPWRIYRPGIVVGHAQTGEIDKIDGPYYAFKFIQKLRFALPEWVPAVGIEGGVLNIVPVDFVAAALDHIAHQDGLDGQCFHLTDPRPYRTGEVLNIFAKAAHAPQMSMRIDARLFDMIPGTLKQLVGSLAPVRRVRATVLEGLGLPDDVFRFVGYPTRFHCGNTLQALEGSGIAAPDLKDYAAAIWDYWERHLDPDVHRETVLHDRVAGLVAVVTGASSGIGEQTALKLAAAGATVILVARTAEKLADVQAAIAADGGTAHAYTADVADLADCDRVIDEILADHGRIDVLINNAGRSIRRSITSALDRFHDYERTMQLNYFGALRLITRALPAMLAQGGGHVINISSIGVLTNAPRFSAYVASKSALDAFTRCAATELSDRNVRFTTINMPLVRTPMISPTKIYDRMPALSPEEAGDLVMQAVIYQPKRIATRLGVAVQVLHFVAPKITEVIMNVGFNMFPDSAAARGQTEQPAPISTEQMAFSYLLKGIHW